MYIYKGKVAAAWILCDDNRMKHYILYARVLHLLFLDVQGLEFS